MSSEEDVAQGPPLRVTLLDQADVAAEICYELSELKHPIRVVPSGSVAVGVLVSSLNLTVSSPQDRTSAMAALEKLFEAARRKDERLSVELAYDQPHLVSVQVAPDWLEANDRVVRHKGVKVPVPCLRTVLLYLLYKTAACFERTRAPARSLQHEQVRTQRLDDALSILYVFSRLVRPRTTAAGVRKAPLLFLEWDHQAWMTDFDRHLRRDPEHESRYESVLDLLSDASFSQLGLRRWAASFVASTKDSAQGVAGVSEPSVHERASLTAGQMLAFLERVRDMILSPFEPASRTARTDDKP